MSKPRLCLKSSLVKSFLHQISLNSQILPLSVFFSQIISVKSLYCQIICLSKPRPNPPWCQIKTQKSSYNHSLIALSNLSPAESSPHSKLRPKLDVVKFMHCQISLAKSFPCQNRDQIISPVKSLLPNYSPCQN